MNERPWVEGYIANFGISLDIFDFLRFGRFFLFFKRIGFLGILGPPYSGIGATIRIGQEMLCLQYAAFFIFTLTFNQKKIINGMGIFFHL